MYQKPEEVKLGSRSFYQSVSSITHNGETMAQLSNNFPFISKFSLNSSFDVDSANFLITPVERSQARELDQRLQSIYRLLKRGRRQRRQRFARVQNQNEGN